jgi:hypothetical protein
MFRTVPRLSRGALRDRHERWVRDAVDVAARETNVIVADGEVVWSWHPDADAKSCRDGWQGDSGKKARSLGRARSKPINHRAGNAGASGQPVVTNSCAFYFAREAAGAAEASGIPCALFSMRDHYLQNSGVFAPRESGHAPAKSSVIPGRAGRGTRNPSIRMFDGRMGSGFALSAQNWRYAIFVAMRALSDKRSALARGMTLLRWLFEK